MGWMNIVKMLGNAAVDASVDGAISVLRTSGSLACVAGGAGFALVDGLNKTFRAAYYGGGVGWGGLNISATFDDTRFGLNYELPLHVSGAKDGETFYGLGDYTDSRSIYLASMVLVVAGTTLKGVGDNLKKWQEYRHEACDRKHFNRAIPPSPSRKEYAYTTAESVLTSVTYLLTAYNITSCLAYYARAFNSGLYLTYPFQNDTDHLENDHANSTYYKGPVVSGSYPIVFKLDSQKVPFHLPYIGNVSVLLEMALNATANVTYGGGLFFKENGTTEVPPLVPQASTGAMSVTTYYLANFFSRKGAQLHNDRITGGAAGYTRVEDEHQVTNQV